MAEEPTERPSRPESADTVVPASGGPSGTKGAKTPTESRDRGRSIALATLGGLVLLGLILLARGPQTPASADATGPGASAGAALTSAEVPPLALAVPAAAGSAPSPATAASPDAGPAFLPAWRVSALEREPGVEVLRGTLGKHALGGALAEAGIGRNEVRRVLHAVDGIHRIEHGVAKDAFVVARDRAKGTLTAFEYVASPTEVWQGKVDKSDDTFTVKRLELHVDHKPASAALLVTTDLAKAIASAGLRADAIEEIEDALEGQGDAAVIKPGVRLKVAGNEEWVEGAFARFRVDALEYVPKSGSSIRLYFYERDASSTSSHRHTPHPGFYDAKGQQPFRGTFRSPLPLARVTSRFNPKRMHPVLHVVMPHNGVDFGATTGTPVFASAPGTVHSAGDGGPCGNMVQIEHTNGLTTAYCHLSRFAAGLHAGQHVEARQLVGYVGQTGRATGPHLHFAVKRGGNFIDPMALKMDGVRTLPPSDRDAFGKRRGELDAALEAIALPSADGVAADEKDEKDDKDEPAGEE